ncbi:DUF2624 domain-containing protein [Bacillus kexueae]|uniref:DUF2624 domain-containing protein n=1 Tax=Aeribacillus kexueae TaxID=2078952 RepID=UPI001FAFABE5|nr:DUF2624 domain-containing protein [Bacillus kexueae]
MILFQKIVNQKINSLKYDELLNYAKQHQIPLTETQARQIVKLIRGKNINIFNDQERLQLLKQVANITSNETAQKVNKMFMEFIQ